MSEILHIEIGTHLHAGAGRGDAAEVAAVVAPDTAQAAAAEVKDDQIEEVESEPAKMTLPPAPTDQEEGGEEEGLAEDDAEIDIE